MTTKQARERAVVREAVQYIRRKWAYGHADDLKLDDAVYRMQVKPDEGARLAASRRKR